MAAKCRDARELFRILLRDWDLYKSKVGICQKISAMYSQRVINPQERELAIFFLRYHKAEAVKAFGAFPFSVYWWAGWNQRDRKNFVEYLVKMA